MDKLTKIDKLWMDFKLDVLDLIEVGPKDQNELYNQMARLFIAQRDIIKSAYNEDCANHD